MKNNIKHIIIWGTFLGLCAFVSNILLPGCIEPFADMLAAFIAAVIVVRRVFPETRRAALQSGILTGLVVGIIIIITDLLTAGLLAAGYIYKDQLPWINLPDLSYLNSIFGNTLLVFLFVSSCMGIIKIILTLLGSAAGGVIFGSPSHPRTKTE
jgi:hypothetical protein